jgi:hypothetical protein
LPFSRCVHPHGEAVCHAESVLERNQSLKSYRQETLSNRKRFGYQILDYHIRTEIAAESRDFRRWHRIFLTPPPALFPHPTRPNNERRF